MQIKDLYQIYLKYPSIQTDTRKVQKGDLFFALKGPNFNGNDFAQQALDKGAAFAIVDEEAAAVSSGAENGQIIRVEDSLQCLQELAHFHRNQFNIPFIAITGSNGKTTTKELVSKVLASHFITATTEGNLNNHIGVPLTLLKIKQGTEMAVIEMGANHQKEIESYCVYTEPTHGIITNCGKAHLEGFGGVEGVKKGKGELFDFIRKHQGGVFIFNDYDYLRDMSAGIHHQFNYGTTEGEITGQILQSEPFLEITSNIGIVKTNLVGAYNLPNVLCAIAVGTFFGVPEQKIIHAIETYAPSNSRSQLIQLGSNQIILDAYNANPTSMKAAIENFANLQADRKVLMLGGMMELGAESIQEHQAILDLIDSFHWKEVVLVGGDFAHIPHQHHFFADSTAAKIWWDEQGFENTFFLIKGSRSIQMEKIIGR